MGFPWTPIIQPQLLSWAAKIVYYCYATVFTSVLVFAVVQLVRFCNSPDRSSVGPKIVFYSFISIGLASRVLYFVLDTIYNLTSWVFFFSVFPGVIFFSTYLLLAGLWVGHGYASRNSASPLEGSRWLYALMNIIIYLAFLALFIVVGIKWNSPLGTEMYVAILLLDGSLNILVGVVFFILGGRVYFALRKVPVRSAIAERRMKRMGMLTFTTTIVLIVRAALIIWGSLSEMSFTVVEYFVFEGCFYILMEVVPIILMMVALGSVPPQSNPTGPATYMPISDQQQQAKTALSRQPQVTYTTRAESYITAIGTPSPGSWHRPGSIPSRASRSNSYSSQGSHPQSIHPASFHTTPQS